MENLHSLKYLILTSNRIRHISGDVSTVLQLDLSFNNLDTFAFHASQDVFYMKNNNLTKLDFKFVSYNTVALDLSFNLIDLIRESTHQYFYSDRLSYLNLSNNNLAFISQSLFRGKSVNQLLKIEILT
jgi:hypothetical protein